MTDGRVLVGPADGRQHVAGGAFLLAGGLAVTANHVVRAVEPALVTVELDDDRPVAVHRIERDEPLDVAVLHLARAPASAVRAGTATAGTPWTVTTRPAPNDPQLSGTVTAAGRTVVNDRGATVTALQLQVEQALDDYRGYSGSAVRRRGRPDIVLGVLCEQVHSRLRCTDGQPRPAANVLYAIALTEVVRRFGLPGADAGADVFRAVRDLVDRGDLAGADRWLAGLPAPGRGSAPYWYWRARVAMARDNFGVADAYAGRALAADPRHAASVAARIRALLLSNGPAQRAAARDLAGRSHGLDADLDAWLTCLADRGLLTAGIRSATELDATCPFPDRDAD